MLLIMQNNPSDLPSLGKITEEVDLSEKKRSFRGKTIKIKKLVKKESGSFTLRDTLMHVEDSQDQSTIMNDLGANILPDNINGPEGVSMGKKKAPATAQAVEKDQHDVAEDIKSILESHSQAQSEITSVQSIVESVYIQNAGQKSENNDPRGSKNQMFKSGQHNNASLSNDRLSVKSGMRDSVTSDGGSRVLKNSATGDMGTSRYISYMLNNKHSKGQRSGDMYLSQAISTSNMTSSQTNFKQDLELDKVPTKVTRCLSRQESEVRYLNESIQKAKSKMESEIEMIVSDFSSMMRQKKEDLSSKFDEYLTMVNNNYSHLHNTVKDFQDSQTWEKLENNKNGERLARLTNINYLKKNNETGELEAYKKEDHSSVTQLRNLPKEVSKLSLEFYASELEKMLTHYPQFAHTRSSANFLEEIKSDMHKAALQGSEDMERLYFCTDHFNFSEIVPEPLIFTSLGESRVNCLTNMKSLSSKSNLSSRIIETGLNTHITCVLNINDDLIAAGSTGGDVVVINQADGGQKAMFSLKEKNQVTSIAKLRSLPLKKKGESKPKDEIFIISAYGGENPFLGVWNLNSQSFLHGLEGLDGLVTQIATLQDGNTIISGTQAGTVYIHHVNQIKPVKVFQSDLRSPVTAIYLLNNLASVAVGYYNGEIKVFDLMFITHPTERTALCADLHFKLSLQSPSPVLCLNESHTNPGLLQSGHEDTRVRIWKMNEGTIEKEIGNNKTPVHAILTVENPFLASKENSYHLISFGADKQDIVFNQPMQRQAFKFKFQSISDFGKTPFTNPKLQLIRKSRKAIEKGINFLTFFNPENAQDGAGIPSLLIISLD